MTHLLKKRLTIVLFLLIIIGTFLRFYNLNWGAPYYFHPDERNIASSVSQLVLPQNMNPHFFAYGSLPIYLIFLTGLPYALLTYCRESVLCSVHFEDAIFIGRMYSAIFSVLLLPLLYSLGKRLISQRAGLLSAALGTFTTGLIQFAHFATFELWSTFFSILVFYYSIMLVDKPTKKTLLLLSLSSGILVSIKATNLLLLPIPFLAIGFSSLRGKRVKKSLSKRLFSLAGSSLFLLLCISLLYVITNPYVFLDAGSFHNSMEYESSVALGTLPVFYTSEFIGSIPLVFQFIKVFPFLLNPIQTIAGIIGIISISIMMVKKRSTSFLLLLSILLLIIPQSFFYVKWTRYMVPTLPFFLLSISFLLETLLSTKRLRTIGIITTIFTVSATCIFGLSYFTTAFVERDTRVQASTFAAQLLPHDAPMIADIYDMGIVPFNDHFSAISLFNYYDLENGNPEATPQILQEKLDHSDYIILPSQRLLATRLTHPKNFPDGYGFFKQLTSNTKRFQKIYETPCSIFCSISYLGDQTFRFEGTANAFERPPLRIYRIMHE